MEPQSTPRPANARVEKRVGKKMQDGRSRGVCLLPFNDEKWFAVKGEGALCLEPTKKKQWVQCSSGGMYLPQLEGVKDTCAGRRTQTNWGTSSSQRGLKALQGGDSGRINLIRDRGRKRKERDENRPPSLGVGKSTPRFVWSHHLVKEMEEGTNLSL